MSRRYKKSYSTEGRGERFQLTLTAMGHQGVALGRHEEMVVFVPHGIPGETVEVAVERRYPDYIEASLVEVLDPSPHRVEAPCRYYTDCGGCQWQHVDYAHQLDLKRDVVVDQMRRIGKFSDPPVAPTLGAEDPWHYRNHARFTVNKEGLLGFVRRGTHRVVPVDECLLMDPWINQTIEQVKGSCAETREMSVRYGVNTGEYLIQPKFKHPGVAMETGQPAYYEELHGQRFRVASPAFFQVNTRQAERLVDVARGYLEPAGRGLLIDAYAGVGTFAVLLAGGFDRVIAMEESGPAVRDAKANAADTPNVEVMEGKVEEILPRLDVHPDAVLLDPPRAGCHRWVLDALGERKPGTLVYVSCDPATLARDLRILVDLGFSLEEVQPVDMFPHTYHIECVAVCRA